MHFLCKTFKLCLKHENPHIPVSSHPLPALYQKVTPIIYKTYSSLVISSAFACVSTHTLVFFLTQVRDALCNFLQQIFLLNMA